MCLVNQYLGNRVELVIGAPNDTIPTYAKMHPDVCCRGVVCFLAAFSYGGGRRRLEVEADPYGVFICR